MKYLKWVFKDNVGHKDNQKFEVGKVITCDTWNPNNNDWDKRGGFNFTNEECALRWMSRGDTLYEVEIPSNGEVLVVRNDKTPGGIIVANKIILKNPIPISDELLIDFYNKSKLPLSTYFECIGLLASRGYYDIALMIIKDTVDMNNIDLALEEFNSSLKLWHEVDYDCYNKVKMILEEIKSPVDINLFIDKEPYIKILSEDKVINLTGESGSGKSYFSNKWKNNDNYILIDTDIVFSTKNSDNKESVELRRLFEDKPKDYLITNFDQCYETILEYFKDTNKIIVIDSAQYRNIKDISILKGKIIIMRTSINKCYERCIKRWKSRNNNYSIEELEQFKNRKLGIFKWYKSLNKFIDMIEKI